MRLRLRIPPWFIVFMVIGSLTAGGYFGYQYYQLSRDPNIAAQREIRQLVRTIGRVLELPTDEMPVLATVSDTTRLADQAFFENVRNGDKVLIYQQAKKAILYRPGTGKIIEIGPVLGELPTIATPAPLATVTASPSPTAPPSPTATPSPTPTKLTIVLLNGTTTVGRTAPVEEQLRTTFANLEIIAKETASRRDYTQTLVIDRTNHPDQAQAVATLLGGAVGQLPEGETAAEADLMVIVGGGS